MILKVERLIVLATALFMKIYTVHVVLRSYFPMLVFTEHMAGMLYLTFWITYIHDYNDIIHNSELVLSK